MCVVEMFCGMFFFCLLNQICQNIMIFYYIINQNFALKNNHFLDFHHIFESIIDGEYDFYYIHIIRKSSVITEIEKQLKPRIRSTTLSKFIITVSINGIEIICFNLLCKRHSHGSWFSLSSKAFRPAYCYNSHPSNVQ